MDIQGASAASGQAALATGRAGAAESSAEQRREIVDSSIERKEAEPSSTGQDVGQNVDLQA